MRRIFDANFIYEQIRLKKTFLCVGLDPDMNKMDRIYLQREFPLFDFCRDIIHWTSDQAVAYKINVAFFENHGPHGWLQLEMLVKEIPSDCFLIIDAKRADIGNTSQRYAEYYFQKLDADAITLHPYMGVDSLQSFIDYKGKWCIVLGLTSNPGAADFELMPLDTGQKLYELIIQKFSTTINHNQLMFVIGATQSDQISHARNLCPEHFFLVPGVGEQGGDLEKTIITGMNRLGGLLINVSRSISYPKSEVVLENYVRQQVAGLTARMEPFIS